MESKLDAIKASFCRTMDCALESPKQVTPKYCSLRVASMSNTFLNFAPEESTAEGGARARRHSTPSLITAGIGALFSSAAEPEVQRPVEETFTTLVVKNLPKKVLRNRLVRDIEATEFCGTFDFCHVPVSFASGRSLGYAFINFRTHEDAVAFMKAWHGSGRYLTAVHTWSLAIDIAAFQGYALLVAKTRACRDKVRNAKYRPFTTQC
mmetsp:Transcript_19998/g.46040  ORF Transcript_19998/g.46040 Transcript_19998/m.46040 type:complete len:208 (-) Transcript_19998:226-849(-)